MRPIGSDDSGFARTPTTGTPLGNLLMPGLSGMAMRPKGAASQTGGTPLESVVALAAKLGFGPAQIASLLALAHRMGGGGAFDVSAVLPVLRRLQAVRAAGSPF